MIAILGVMENGGLSGNEGARNNSIEPQSLKPCRVPNTCSRELTVLETVLKNATDGEDRVDTAEQQAGIPVSFTINGARHDVGVEPWVTLLDLLRERLHLTGTKKGCDQGQCGACTILVDGIRINSCLALAVSRDGADITTVEGLADGEDLHPIQAAFVEHDAFQCGYCTPGQLCSAVGLLAEGHSHSRAEIREHMSGNLCRCGAYTNIADAIEDVMKSTASLREAAE
jgi:xanthine dehydrogenase YagT iron-sulfur-binding subunit